MIIRTRNPYLRLMDDLFREPFPWRNEFTSLAALDVDETDEHYIVRADVPGISHEGISVNIHDDVLSVSAEAEAADSDDQSRALMRERRSRKFSRSLRFPVPVDGDAVEASLEHGVLNITVPKAQQHQPRQIPVSVNASV